MTRLQRSGWSSSRVGELGEHGRPSAIDLFSQPMAYVRPLTDADAEAYWHIRLEALETEPLAFGTSADEHRMSTIADAAARLARDPTEPFVLGAFSDGRLRGMAGFARETRQKTRHKGSIWGVYVAPEYRGRGVGRLLLETLLQRARALPDLERLTLLVSTEQTAARILYGKLGFECFGTEPAALKLGGTHVAEEYLFLVLGRRHSATLRVSTSARPRPRGRIRDEPSAGSAS